MAKKMRVLFLCTHNSARSQMAEAFLRDFAGDRFEAYSAGLEPHPVRPEAIQVMRELGYDISAQRSKPLSEFMGRVHFTYLITMCQDAEDRCPTAFPGMGIRLNWHFDDPSAFEGTQDERLERFREIRDQIADRLKQWLAEENNPPESAQ